MGNRDFLPDEMDKFRCWVRDSGGILFIRGLLLFGAIAGGFGLLGAVVPGFRTIGLSICVSTIVFYPIVYAIRTSGGRGRRMDLVFDDDGFLVQTRAGNRILHFPLPPESIDQFTWLVHSSRGGPMPTGPALVMKARDGHELVVAAQIGMDAAMARMADGDRPGISKPHLILDIGAWMELCGTLRKQGFEGLDDPEPGDY